MRRLFKVMTVLSLWVASEIISVAQVDCRFTFEEERPKEVVIAITPANAGDRSGNNILIRKIDVLSRVGAIDLGQFRDRSCIMSFSAEGYVSQSIPVERNRAVNEVLEVHFWKKKYIVLKYEFSDPNKPTFSIKGGNRGLVTLEHGKSLPLLEEQFLIWQGDAAQILGQGRLRRGKNLMLYTAKAESGSGFIVSRNNNFESIVTVPENGYTGGYLPLEKGMIIFFKSLKQSGTDQVLFAKVKVVDLVSKLPSGQGN